MLEYRGTTSGNWYAVTYNGQDAWISKSGSSLIEEIPKYHGGGIVGAAGAVNKKEVVAVLEKGELVLDDRKQEGLYRMIDFQQALSERLGKTIGSLASAFFPVMPAFSGGAMTAAIAGGAGSTVFSPNVTVEIHHSGELDSASAREYGRTIADATMDELYGTFGRKGLNTLFGSRLKKK